MTPALIGAKAEIQRLTYDIDLARQVRRGVQSLWNDPSQGHAGGLGPIDTVDTVETKNWNGKVDVRNDRLFVSDYDRTWVVAQVYREAPAVQLTLGDELTSYRVTVTPVLCAIGGATVGAGMADGVRVVDGKHLARTIADRPPIFDDEQVQRLARLADCRRTDCAVQRVGALAGGHGPPAGRRCRCLRNMDPATRAPTISSSSRTCVYS